MGDGKLGKCKQCTRNDAKKNRDERLKDPEWAAKEAKRQRKKSRVRAVLFPEKAQAHNACRSLKKDGLHLHHWSYHKEHHRDVFEMTPEDHRAVHAVMVYDQERLMYRDASNMELLDTREKAAAFYKRKLG